MANYPIVPQVDKIKNRQDYEYIVISEDEKHQGADLKYYLSIIKKRRWIIISPLLLTIPIMLIFVALEKPIYNATTRLMIEDVNSKVSETSRLEEFYKTQYEIIKSNAILGEVVQTLQLDRQADAEEALFMKMKDAIVGFPRMIVEKIIDNLSELLNSKGESRKYNDTSSTTTSNSNNPRLYRAIARLKDKLKIVPVKDTKLVDISISGSDPVEVTRQVEMIADVYIRRNLEGRLDATRKSINWLKSEADTLREKVRKSQSSLQEFNDNKKLVFNENNEGKNVNQQQLDAFGSSYIDIHMARMKIQATLEDMDKLSKKDMEEMIEYPAFLENPTVRMFRTKYLDLKTQYSSLANLYKDQHPKIIQIKSEMDSLKNNIRDEIKKINNSMQKEYKSLLAKEENIKTSLGNQQKNVLNINKDLTKYSEKKGDIDINKELYITVSKRLGEATLTEALEDNNIKIIEKARVPTQPQSKRVLKMAFSIILGFGIGGCLAGIAEHLDKRFKTVDDAERELEIPFLGFIPHFQIDRRKADRLITLQDPAALASESYRTIRTLIQLSTSPQKRGNTLLLTSATPGEGKSTTAANLAISFAQLGLEVLLVDADLRRPSLDRIFNLEGCIGLAEILMTGVDWKEAIQYIGIDNLKILLTGFRPPNPTELLSTPRMKNLIQTWKECFDIIIFDSPIALSIPDVAVLAPEMDRVLLIHCPDKIGKEEIMAANRRLKRIGANIYGIVFNNVGSKELRHYYAQTQLYNSYYSSKSNKSLITLPGRILPQYGVNRDKY